MVADFEVSKQYELTGSQKVMDKGIWLPTGTKLEILRNNVDFDNTLVVRLPSGKMATVIAGMLKSEDKIEYVEFSAQAVSDGDAIVKLNGIDHVRCKIPILFKTGDYPEKKFSMTPAEAQESLKDFNDNVKEVPIPISHRPTVFDKHNTAKLDKLELAGVDKNGSATFSASGLVPVWLKNFISKDGAWGISARWTNLAGQVKRLVHAALVPNPAIDEAKIVAEFERVIPTITGYAAGASTPGKTQESGEDLPQVPPDAANRPPMSPNSAKRSPSLTASADQATPPGNETVAAPGGVQNADRVGGNPQADDVLEDAGAPDDEDSRDSLPKGPMLLEALSDLIDKALEDCDDQCPPDYVAKLTELKEVLGGAGGGGADTPATGDTPVPPAPAIVKPERANSDMLPNEDFSKEELLAKHEAEKAVLGKKLGPDDAKKWEVKLLRAQKDDRKIGVADFASGDSRYSQLLKELTNLPINPLFVNAGDLKLLTGDKTTGQADFEKNRAENESLLARTAVGRYALDMRKQKR